MDRQTAEASRYSTPGSLRLLSPCLLCHTKCLPLESCPLPGRPGRSCGPSEWSGCWGPGSPSIRASLVYNLGFLDQKVGRTDCRHREEWTVVPFLFPAKLEASQAPQLHCLSGGGWHFAGGQPPAFKPTVQRGWMWHLPEKLLWEPRDSPSQAEPCLGSLGSFKQLLPLDL